MKINIGVIKAIKSSISCHMGTFWIWILKNTLTTYEVSYVHADFSAFHFSDLQGSSDSIVPLIRRGGDFGSHTPINNM